MLLFLAISLGIWQPATGADLDLEFAVEATVRDWQPKSKPPEAIRSYFKQMDSTCFHCRENGTRKLWRESLTNPRWLYWGLDDKSPEVRYRCRKLIRSLRPCLICFGPGVCPMGIPKDDSIHAKYEQCRRCDSWALHSQPGVCLECAGTGSAWWQQSP